MLYIQYIYVYIGAYMHRLESRVSVIRFRPTWRLVGLSNYSKVGIYS